MNQSPLSVKKIGDVTLIAITKDQFLAIATDSAGGIGMKPNDVLSVPPETVGYFTAVVPVMEVIALGAEIISLVDTLSVEMHPTGVLIIKGIQKLMDEIGLDHERLNGSTEENMQVSSTGLGITCIGMLDLLGMEKQKTRKKDLIAIIGKPKMGEQLVKEELVEGRGEIMTLSLLKKLRSTDGVHQIRPVGSKGINYELTSLKKEWVELELINKNSSQLSIDLNISAGPGTCCICTMTEMAFKEIKSYIDLPIEEYSFIQ